jgi:hypothetical protein
MRKTKHPDNQGKCCDAVLRILEERLGRSRSDLQFPELEEHAARVELACRIGGNSFALEHTKLLAYPDQIQDGVNFLKALAPLEHDLSGRLPKTGSFMLIVPWLAFRGLSTKEAVRIREVIAAWVLEVAPTMKLNGRGCATTMATPRGVPFPVSIDAWVGPQDSPGTFRIARREPPDLEAMRLTAAGKALADKLPKLRVWSEFGAKSVLILETEDVTLANHHGKAIAALQQLLPMDGYVPDYVFFVYAQTAPWLVQTLVMERTIWSEADILRWPSYQQFDPSGLIDAAP